MERRPGMVRRELTEEVINLKVTKPESKPKLVPSKDVTAPGRGWGTTVAKRPEAVRHLAALKAWATRRKNAGRKP